MLASCSSRSSSSSTSTTPIGAASACVSAVSRVVAGATVINAVDRASHSPSGETVRAEDVASASGDLDTAVEDAAAVDGSDDEAVAGGERHAKAFHVHRTRMNLELVRIVLEHAHLLYPTEGRAARNGWTSVADAVRASRAQQLQECIRRGFSTKSLKVRPFDDLVVCTVLRGLRFVLTATADVCWHSGIVKI